MDYLTRLRMPTVLRLEVTAEALRYNRQTLMTYNPPLVLIGEPGIGKTTWLLHFFRNPIIERTFYHYRLDGTAMLSPLLPLDPPDYVQHSLRSGIVKMLRERSERVRIDTPACSIDSDTATPSVVEQTIRDSVIALAEHHQVGWVILDNLDRQKRAVQHAAIAWAKNLSTLGLKVLVPIRPYTLGIDDTLYDLDSVTVPPPALSALLKKRSEYALESPLGTYLLRQLSSGIGATLVWTGGEIRDDVSLMGLWKRVAETLDSLPALHRHLFNVHLGDLHEIMQDLRELMHSGYFCQEMMRRLALGSSRSQHEFLTAYVRGNYHHHRQNELSGRHMVNLYEVRGSDRKHRLLIIRFLQFLRKLTDFGASVKYSDLRADLHTCGYEGDQIDAVARFVVNKRLVVEVKRFIDWHNRALTLKNDDELELSQSGRYYLDVLVATPRYIEAMADVTYLDDSVVRQMPTECHSADDGFRKGLLFMREVGRIIGAEHDRLGRAGLLPRFYEKTDVGQGFFYPGVQASLSHARKLYAKGKLSQSVVNDWESLFEVARAFRAQRGRALGLGD